MINKTNNYCMFHELYSYIVIKMKNLKTSGVTLRPSLKHYIKI